MMERILVTGASELSGTKLVKFAEHSFEVIPTHNTRSFSKNSVKMNITNDLGVLQAIVKMKPDVVMHVAPETGVDQCEKSKEEAWKVNADGTKNIAVACGKINAKLIYVSMARTLLVHQCNPSLEGECPWLKQEFRTLHLLIPSKQMSSEKFFRQEVWVRSS